MDKNEKVILKTYGLPGVDMSVVDLEMVSTVKVGITKVTKTLYKEKGQTFIGTKDQLDNSDVIQTGKFGIKYKVVKLVKMTDRNGYIYRINRIDGAKTTSVDIDSSRLGGRVRIVNRKTFDQLFNYACSQQQENPVPTTVCEEDAVACDTPDDTEPSTTIVESTSKRYRVTYSLGVAGLLVSWIDENGGLNSTALPDVKDPESFIICAVTGSVEFGGVAYWPNNVTCPPGDTCTTSTNPTLELIGDC